MAGTKRKLDLGELGNTTELMELSDTEKASQDDIKQPSSSGNEEQGAMCHICHGTVADESGQPLRRDCACRGTDAGFVHLSCLTKYGETKSNRSCDMEEFRKPWKTCLCCHQEYQNKLAVDIATEFVSFVRRKYPDDTQKQVEAFNLKMCAFESMFDRLQPVQKREVGDKANVLLSLIDRMKGDASPLPRRYSQMESYAYYAHGRIALDEGTGESARRAVVHFEKDLKVCEAIGDADGIAAAKQNIAYAKSMYEGGNNNEELLNASRDLYEMRIAEDGEGNVYTIDAGKKYAEILQKANRGDEARDLLTKLLATSKQVFGPDHNITKEVVSALKQVVDDEDSDSSVPQCLRDDNVDDISNNIDDNDDDGWEENA